MKKLFLFLGRICLSLIFVCSAVGKLFSWDETVQYMALSLSHWMSGPPMLSLFNEGFSFISSHAVFLLVIATLMEGWGGLSVLLGFKVRWGATLLILFLIPVTILMHPFWLESGQEKTIQTLMFMKNLGILGGLLVLAATTEESKG